MKGVWAGGGGQVTGDGGTVWGHLVARWGSGHPQKLNENLLNEMQTDAQTGSRLRAETKGEDDEDEAMKEDRICLTCLTVRSAASVRVVQQI